MGSDRHYPEEAPVHHVTVGPFWIDRTPVTNHQLRRFVETTGYVNVAEVAPDPKDYPGALPHMLSRARSSLPRRATWSTFGTGRNGGASSSVRTGAGRTAAAARTTVSTTIPSCVSHTRMHKPAWAGKELPTEADWEYAARGGLDGAEFARGDELTPGGRHMANTWQGEFPHVNLSTDGYTRTSPVGAFPANGYGLYDCRPYRPAARHAQPVDTGMSHIGSRSVVRP